MATYHVAPKGTVTGANNGGSGNNAWNGIKALYNALSGSTVAGDTIIFDGDKGPFSFADNADFAYTGGLTGAFVYAAGASGPILGSSSLAASSASGRIFQFASSTGQAVIDMHRSDANHTGPERMYAALSIQGEGMTILNPKVIAPNFNYLKAVNGPNAQAESVSAENHGLRIAGNGNTIDGADIVGYADTQGFCRAALPIVHELTGTAGLTTRVSNLKSRGAFFGFNVAIQGSGAQYSGEFLASSLDVADCSWGSTAELGFVTGNAGTHGGYGAIGGNWRNAVITRLKGRGVCQDGIDLIGVNCKITNSDLRGMYAPGVMAWVWNATSAAWEWTYVAGVTGNGIKMGFVQAGTSPTTWRGTDGIPGGIYNTDENRNSAIGNVIEDCMSGITSNTGNGQFVHANEVYGAVYGGITMDAYPNRANYWISNNYAQMRAGPRYNTDAAAGQFVTNAALILVNNIFDASLSPDAYDVRWATQTAPMLKNNNLLVTGRVKQNYSYPTTGDIASFDPGWIKEVGLPAGSSLIRAGAHNGYRTDRRGVQFWNPPSVGPLEYQLARASRV
jgi:hypothetical protein